MAKEVAIRVTTMRAGGGESPADFAVKIELVRPLPQEVVVPGRYVRALHAALAQVIATYPPLCGPDVAEMSGESSYEFRLPGNAAEKAGDN